MYKHDFKEEKNRIEKLRRDYCKVVKIIRVKKIKSVGTLTLHKMLNDSRSVVRTISK